jgi:hypothetical protein
MADDQKRCGQCSHRRWVAGTCKSWCDKKKRVLTDEEWEAACENYNDWKKKEGVSGS